MHRSDRTVVGAESVGVTHDAVVHRRLRGAGRRPRASTTTSVRAARHDPGAECAAVVEVSRAVLGESARRARELESVPRYVCIVSNPGTLADEGRSNAIRLYSVLSNARLSHRAGYVYDIKKRELL